MLISNVIWMGSGFVVHSVTGRMLGPTAYGTFGIVYAIISTSYIVLGGGVKRAVTKYAAGAPDQAGDIRIAGLKVQLYICAVITALLFIISAPVSIWLHDDNLKTYIRYSSAIVPVAGVLYIYIGYFDGCKQFGRTAIVTIAHSILKVTFVFTFLFLGYEIFGVITGLLMGLSGALIFALLLGRHAPVIQRFEKKKIIQFSVPVLSFFICISILSYIDLFFVKAFLNDPAKTGYYTAAQTIAKLISFAMVPFGIVLLPSISSAIARNDLISVRRYIDGSLRYILIVLVPTCMLLCTTARQIIIFIYGQEYAFGATSLSILFFGTSCWGITSAMVAIIQGYGQPGKPAMIFAIMIPVDIILIQIFIRPFGIEGAAIATACTFITGMILAGVTIYKRYSVLINIRAVLNILIASFIACARFIFLTPSGNYLLLCYILAFCIYAIALWVLGELKRGDMDLLVNSIKRGRS
jgi:stage V sporulation protein B